MKCPSGEQLFPGNHLLLVGFKCSREHSNYTGGVIPRRGGFRFAGYLLSLQGTVKFSWGSQFSFCEATFLEGMLYFLVVSLM